MFIIKFIFKSFVWAILFFVNLILDLLGILLYAFIAMLVLVSSFVIAFKLITNDSLKEKVDGAFNEFNRGLERNYKVPEEKNPSETLVFQTLENKVIVINNI